MSSDGFDLETLLTHPDGFGLTTASPLQRLICRIIDGKALTMTDELKRALGTDQLPEGIPDEVVLLAAIRCAKSLISAAVAFQKSQTVDISRCGPGHYPLLPVLSTSKKNATVVFDHLVGRIMRSPLLKSRLIGEPAGDTVWLRHPSGVPIEVSITAGARAGSSLIARWMATVIFDEAPRMVGQEEGVINLDDSMKAISGRILPGGQVLYIGYPKAPFGPVYNMVTEHFGKPTRELVVIRATGPTMYPDLYTPEYCEKLRKKNEAAYRENVMAEFSDPESAMFGLTDVEGAMRKEPPVLPAKAGQSYRAAMDPATRGNAWTLVVVTSAGLGGPLGAAPAYQVVLTTQWRGSKGTPLAPDTVFREMAALLKPYAIETIETDQYAFDALVTIAERHSLSLQSTAVTTSIALENAERIKTLLQEGRLELSPDLDVKADLLMARKRISQSGPRLILPDTRDGRHGDYVPALGLALADPPEMPIEPEKPKDHFQRLLERERSETTDHWEQIGKRLVGRV